ncbi:unnamed protein product [Phytomonas sp. Hart1]|nr:unnamed protein product [Phytomonas sp. Hart1]|eukprot:CCW69805.1 unnamed protein product [Phytomonas sp. isolate Hart1]
MSGDSFLTSSSPSPHSLQRASGKSLLLRSYKDPRRTLSLLARTHETDDKPKTRTPPRTAPVHSGTMTQPFLDSDEESSGMGHPVVTRGVGTANGEAAVTPALKPVPVTDPRYPVCALAEPRPMGITEVSHGNENPTRPRPLGHDRLKLHIPYPARDNGKETKNPVAIGWWGRFLEVDLNGCFQHRFESTLRSLDRHSAGVFYEAMVKAFEKLWREHWDVLILSQGPSFGASQEIKNSTGRGRPRKLSSRQTKSQKEDNSTQRLHFTCAGLEWWYESVRVARLMAEDLLRAGKAADKSNAQGGELGCEPLQRPWVFEEGCQTAFVAITQIPVDNGSMNLNRWVRKNAENGLVKLYERADSHMEVPLGQEIKKTNDMHVAIVPSPERMLRLLHILDEAWIHPNSKAFRLPVPELEAPGYYGKISDAASLYSLYADVLRGATLDSIKHGEGDKKGHSSNDATLRTSGDEFINYRSLRERFTILQNNCTTYNGISSELACCAERLVNAARKAIRDAQSDEKDTVLQDTSPLVGRRGEHQHQPHAKKGSSWTAEELEAAFPPSKMAKEFLLAQKCDETGLNLNHGTEPFSKVDETSKSPRVLRLIPHSQDNLNIKKNKKNNPDHRTKTKAQKLKPPKASSTSAKKKDTIFWVCCDECRTWRKLPKRIDPPPHHWVCSYMGLECDEASKEQVAPSNPNVKRPRRRLPRLKDLPKTKKRPRVSKRSDHDRKLKESSNSSSTSSSGSDTDNDDTDESASSTSTNYMSSEKLQAIESELGRLEREPVNEDPHGLLKRLRLLEKKLDI